MFNSTGCLICYILKLLFLDEYKGECKYYVTYSFLDFLNAGLQSPEEGLIKKSLFWMLLFECN